MTDPNELNEVEESKPESLGRSIFRSAWGLGLFAIITAGLIALTQVVTKDRIADQIKQARSKALLEIVPIGQFDNDLLDNAFWLKAETQLGLKEAIGLRVIEHKETPGLGDKIDIKKSDWIRSFEGRSLENTEESGWAVKKDGGEFDQMTGATITPRAIVNAVYKGLQYYQNHQSELLLAAGLDSPKQQVQSSIKEGVQP